MPPSPDLTERDLRDAYLTRFPQTVYGLNEWRRYSGGIWLPIHELAIRREIQLVVEAEASQGVPVKFSSQLVTSVFNLLKARKFVDASLFDANPDILPFADCVLSLTNFETTEHRPDNYLTSKLPYSYDVTAQSKCWEDFLKATAGDATAFLQEFAGYCLTIDTQYEIAVWLYGQPGGGKSTFIKGLEAMLGDRTIVLGLHDIESSSFGLTNLPGKTLAVATEQPAGHVKASHYINAIVSGERIRVNRKHIDAIDITPRAKLLWAMNELPRIDSKGAGIFRRVKIAHFPAILPELRNPAVKAEIAESGMAIANWAITGLKRLRERKAFLIPRCVEDASEHFRLSNDVPLMFIDDCCERGDDYRAGVSDLYGRYRVWCRSNGYMPEASRKFAADMDRLGFDKGKSGTEYRKGIRLLLDATTEQVLSEYAN